MTRIEKNYMIHLVIGLLLILLSFICTLIIVVMLNREDMLNYDNNIIDILLRNESLLILFILSVISISFGLIFLVYYLTQILSNNKDILDEKSKLTIKERILKLYLRLRKFQD